MPFGKIFECGRGLSLDGWEFYCSPSVAYVRESFRQIRRSKALRPGNPRLYAKLNKGFIHGYILRKFSWLICRSEWDDLGSPRLQRLIKAISGLLRPGKIKGKSTFRRYSPNNNNNTLLLPVITWAGGVIHTLSGSPSFWWCLADFLWSQGPDISSASLVSKNVFIESHKRRVRGRNSTQKIAELMQEDTVSHSAK